MFYVPQIQKDDCGFSCLKMMLASLNKDKNYLFIPQDESHGYYSFGDLIDIAKKYDVNLTGLEVSKKDEVINCSSFPFIAPIFLKNGARHAILVTKIKWKRVYFLDPREGKKSCSLSKFLKIWDGSGLFLESFEKKKCSFIPISPMKNSTKISLFFWQFVAGVLTVLGVYFIKDNTPIYYSAIFLSGAIVAELIMHAMSYRAMKKLDQFLLSDDYLPKTNIREYLSRFENYKKLSLSSAMNLILMFIFVIGLSAVVLLNDHRNGMLVVVPVVIAIIDVLLIKPFLKSKKMEIIDLENSLEEPENREEITSILKTIHMKAYSYSYIDVACRYIYGGLLLLTSLLTMHLCSISSFPYIIFYTCVSLAILKGLLQIFNFGDAQQEYVIAKIKMMNSINFPDENT